MYELLELEIGATKMEIDKGFCYLALSFHPNDLKWQGHHGIVNKFELICQAYSILSKTDLKEKYDDWLNSVANSEGQSPKKHPVFENIPAADQVFAKYFKVDPLRPMNSNRLREL